MARRRRTKYTWLPTVGTAGIDNLNNVSGRSFIATVPLDGSVSVILGTLTFDAPLEGDDLFEATTPLGTVLGNEYFIRRVVGKFFAEHSGTRAISNDPSVPHAALIGFGIFIARANDADAGGGANTPIGSASAAERAESYNPLGEDCIREPWLFRRTWILGNAAFARQRVEVGVSDFVFSPFTVPGVTFPSNTADYGSIQDGPHVDAKTARRVRQDERLFLAISTMSWPVGTVTDAASVVNGYFDFRILGALRKARNRGSF